MPDRHRHKTAIERDAGFLGIGDVGMRLDILA